jgi:hypothetical protein
MDLFHFVVCFILGAIFFYILLQNCGCNNILLEGHIGPPRMHPHPHPPADAGKVKTSTSDFQPGCSTNEVQMECIAREKSRVGQHVATGMNEDVLCATWYAKTGGSSCVSAHNENGKLVNCILQDKCTHPPPTTTICGDISEGCSDEKAELCEHTPPGYMKESCCNLHCHDALPAVESVAPPAVESVICPTDVESHTSVLLSDNEAVTFYNRCTSTDNPPLPLYMQVECCNRANAIASEPPPPPAQMTGGTYNTDPSHMSPEKRCAGKWSEWISSDGISRIVSKKFPDGRVPCKDACDGWFPPEPRNCEHLEGPVLDVTGKLSCRKPGDDIGISEDFGPGLHLTTSSYSKLSPSLLPELDVQGVSTTYLNLNPPRPTPLGEGGGERCTRHPHSSIYGTQHSHWILDHPTWPISTDSCSGTRARVCIMTHEEQQAWCVADSAHCSIVETKLTPVLVTAETTYGGPELGCALESAQMEDAGFAPSGGGCR